MLGFPLDISCSGGSEASKKHAAVNDFHGDVADYERKTLKARPKQIPRLRVWARAVAGGSATYREFFSTYCTAMHVAEVQGWFYILLSLTPFGKDLPRMEAIASA